MLTLSIHETGQTLFPGTGFTDERGGAGALGTKVNVPVQPSTGDASWLAALTRVVPALAQAFRPTFLVTQHGCDTHAYDPLAHLRLTTRAYRAATLLMDEIAHEHCEGRWVATGGGGYDAYRVVPRSWSLCGSPSNTASHLLRSTRPGATVGRETPTGIRPGAIADRIP